jgi:structural maintenance of chromosome 3 (chondroitin sulfate proteoglycan 6)
MALSTMRDGERLALLKEIGGTRVYEERRRESLKILAETDARRARIQEVVRRRSFLMQRW